MQSELVEPRSDVFQYFRVEIFFFLPLPLFPAAEDERLAVGAEARQTASGHSLPRQHRQQVASTDAALQAREAA